MSKLTKTELTERYKSNALKQAIETYKSCINKKVKTHQKIPIFKGYPILDQKFVNIQNGQNTFDLYIKLSTLKRNCRIYLPTKKTQVFNYWEKQNWELVHGCELHANHVVVWFKTEEKYNKTGDVLGLDLGMKKYITLSNGTFLGTEFTKYRKKIESKKKNSKNYKKAIRELKCYLNQEINKIPFEGLKALGYENLTGITKGKTGFRQNIGFRKAQQHWNQRGSISRIIEKCQENRVRPVYVNPKNTSCTCQHCKHVAKANRNGENFTCLKCGYSLDADLNGAGNILAKTLLFLGSLESPLLSQTC